MEQSIDGLVDAIDAPAMEGVAILIATPEGWGGALLTLTLGCGRVNPMVAILEGVECQPRKAMFEYRLTEPSTLVMLDVDIPRPCYLHIDAVASKGSSTKGGTMIVGVSDDGPVVIGLPYSIYSPLYLQ
ncbi:hypothetical protein [Microcoleus phage My-WqHQDG]|nr:hypothetical protein [Microcoleus phage My-WqHQDG]